MQLYYPLTLPSTGGFPSAASFPGAMIYVSGGVYYSDGSVWTRLNLLNNSEPANRVLASPSGGSGNPSFRLLAAADIPSLDKGKITPSGALIQRSSNFSVATGGAPATDMNWNAETYDTNAYFTSGSDPAAFVIPTTGIYVFRCNINFAFHATGMRVMRMFVDRGSGYANEPGCFTVRVNAIAAGSAMTEMNGVSAPISLAATNKVIVRVGQDSGGNLNVVSAPSSWFSVERVG